MSFYGEVSFFCEAVLDNCGCEGDREGLRQARGDGYDVVKSYGNEQGYGHHSYNTIYKTNGGELIHAECGGCSCGGSGGWEYVKDLEAGRMLVPEQERE